MCATEWTVVQRFLRILCVFFLFVFILLCSPRKANVQFFFLFSLQLAGKIPQLNWWPSRFKRTQVRVHIRYLYFGFIWEKKIVYRTSLPHFYGYRPKFCFFSLSLSLFYSDGPKCWHGGDGDRIVCMQFLSRYGCVCVCALVIFSLVRTENVVYSRLVSLIFCLFPFVSSRVGTSKHSSIGFPVIQKEFVAVFILLLLCVVYALRPISLLCCELLFSIIANMTKSAKIISIGRTHQ